MTHHSSPYHECEWDPACSYTGQIFLANVKLGDEEDHMMWDRREHIRPTLKSIVRKLLGADKVAANAPESKLASDSKFIKRLLKNTDILLFLEKEEAKHSPLTSAVKQNTNNTSEPDFLPCRNNSTRKKEDADRKSIEDINELNSVIWEEKLKYENDKND